MRRGGHQIGEKKCGLASARQLHALHVRGVTWHASQFHPRSDRAIALEQRQFAFRFQPRVVFQDVAGAVAFVGMLGVFEFSALHHVLRVGIRGDDLISFHARVSAAMIEMQVRVDHDVNFAGI